MKLTDVKKLKVVELRVKLNELGLDTKGLKAELVARLWSALDHQSIAEQLPSGRHGSSVSEGINVDVDIQHEQHTSETQPTEIQTQVNVLLETDAQPWETVITGATDICPTKERDSTHTETRTISSELLSVDDDDSAPDSGIGNVHRLVSSTDHDVQSVTQQEKLQEIEKPTPHRSVSPELANKGSIACHLTSSEEYFHTAKTLVDITTETGNLYKCHVAGEEGPSDISTPSQTQTALTQTALTQTDINGAGEEHIDHLKSVNTTSCGPIPLPKDQEEHQRNKRPQEERDRGYYEFKEEVQYKRAKTPDAITEVNEDNEVDEQLVVLDSYNSDLHFKVGEDGTSGQPLLWEKYPLLWSGCRLSHGVQYGKVIFEVKYAERLLPCVLEEGADPEPHALRVGWSRDNTSLQLGETELSYGFDSRGRKVTQGREEDFGEPFSEGDVISCYAWISDTEESELSFYKNGRSLGVAFRLDPSQLKGHALYPHVLCKNCSVSLNLDPVGAPWYCGPAGFTPLSALQPHKRTRAPRPSASRKECEVVMMVGMPGSGKTHWAQVLMAQHPEKRYNLLSTDTVLACMRGVGCCAQREVVLQQASQCLTQLIRVATGKRRNYILDQTNVYPSARRHKMQLFSGFRRRAVVVFPSDEEWQRRLALNKTKEVPEVPLLKVKVSFTLPETGDLLEEVGFTELPREEAQRLLTGYKEEARRLLPTPPKRKKPRNKRSQAPPPGRTLRNTGSYRRHPGWMNQHPNVPPPHWVPPPRQDMYGYQGSRNDYGYHTGQWNAYYGAPGHFSDRNYMYGTDQAYW